MIPSSASGGTARLRAGQVLLLADAGSFAGAYLRHALNLSAITVLAPRGPVCEAYAALTDEEWGPVVGGIAAEIPCTLCSEIKRSARALPWLFVGCDVDGSAPGPFAWMRSPFASYQVIDRLAAMMPLR
jgi:hypothetical protein